LEQRELPTESAVYALPRRPHLIQRQVDASTDAYCRIVVFAELEVTVGDVYDSRK